MKISRAEDIGRQRPMRKQLNTLRIMERETRIELATNSLEGCCSVDSKRLPRPLRTRIAYGISGISTLSVPSGRQTEDSGTILDGSGSNRRIRVLQTVVQHVPSAIQLTKSAYSQGPFTGILPSPFLESGAVSL